MSLNAKLSYFSLGEHFSLLRLLRFLRFFLLLAVAGVGVYAEFRKPNSKIFWINLTLESPCFQQLNRLVFPVLQGGIFMSDGMKVYYWLNLILNPIILAAFLLAAITETDNEAILGIIMGVGIAWSIISGIINEKLRKWVLGSLKAFIGGTLFVAIFGLIVAAIIFAVVAAVYMIFGYLFLLIFLFVDSLMTVRKTQRGLI